MCSVETSSPHPCSLDELERQICELAAHIAAATCRWLLLIAEFDERRGWTDWGIRSCAHWLSWRCSISLRTAREHVRVGHCLLDRPLIREAFARGELTYCKVRALTRVAADNTEADLVMIARHATGAQLDKLVRGIDSVMRATRDGAQLAHERRGLSWCRDNDGSLVLEGRLAPDDAAVFLAAVAAMQEQLEGQPARQARADALVSMARCALASQGPTGADGEPCEVVVHVDAATLGADRIAERSELQDGPALAPETVRRLGCDASIVRIIERDGKPLTVGRRRRTISPALRRALRSRDDGCQFPGCSHRRFLHAHHIRHWARGGKTELANLVQLCSYHHRLVHEGGFRVERVGGAGLRFRRPDGREIAQAPRCPEVDGGGLIRQHAREGLRVDGNTCRPLSAGDRLDYDHAIISLLNRPRGPG